MWNAGVGMSRAMWGTPKGRAEQAGSSHCSMLPLTLCMLPSAVLPLWDKPRLCLGALVALQAFARCPFLIWVFFCLVWEAPRHQEVRVKWMLQQ